MIPDPDRIVAAFRRADVGWYFDQDRDARVERFLREVGEVEEECRRRGHPEDAARVLSLCLGKPWEMAALIQSFLHSMTPQMRTMIYLLLAHQDQGASISTMSYEYEEKARSRLKVTLRLSFARDAETQTFESGEPWDAEILNHLQMMTIGRDPLLIYCAFRPPESTPPEGTDH